jgi:hypothetical protein
MTTYRPLAFSLSLTLLSLGAGCAEPVDPAVASPDVRVDLATTAAAHFAITRVEDGVLFAAQVGAERPACGDRTRQHECAIAELDLTRADLLPEDELTVRARLAEGTALVRAKLVRGSEPGTSMLVATQVWVRHAAAETLANERAQKERLFVLRDVHEACGEEKAGCRWLRAEPVSAGAAAHHSALDLTLLGGLIGDAEERAIARGELLAHGVGVGPRFVAATLFAPFAPRTERVEPPTGDPPILN